jgi:hypothetical protein
MTGTAIDDYRRSVATMGPEAALREFKAKIDREPNSAYATLRNPKALGQGEIDPLAAWQIKGEKGRAYRLPQGKWTPDQEKAVMGLLGAAKDDQRTAPTGR